MADDAPPQPKKAKPTKVVSPDEWRKARLELLQQEKELTRQRARVAQARQSLPWQAVPKDYSFSYILQDDDDDKKIQTVKLSNLLTANNKNKPLIVWHLMFAGTDKGGCCKLCSLFLDTFQGLYEHLLPRAQLVAIAPAPPQDLKELAQQKEWSFPLLSCQGTTFPHDYNVGFSTTTANQTANNGDAARNIYNYTSTWKYGELAPGMSVFQRNEDDGSVCHTYSSYGAGLADFNATFAFLDALPEGRNEGEKGNMWWVKHKEDYTHHPNDDFQC